MDNICPCLSLDLLLATITCNQIIINNSALLFVPYPTMLEIMVKDNYYKLISCYSTTTLLHVYWDYSLYAPDDCLDINVSVDDLQE